MFRNMVLAKFSLWQAVLVAFVTAVEWDGPKPTSSRLITSGPAPRPTNAPDLRKRDAWPASFCGFVGASSELAVSCSQHSSCVWNTDWFVVGCCATASRDCLFYTSCIDDTSPSTDADDSLVFTCRGTKTCYENNYPSNYRQWGCGYNATFIALTYSNMSAGAATIQQAFIGTAELADVTTVTTTAFSTSTSNSDNSKTSTGTIVGAAVGGAAVLVIGASILAWLLLRRKKNNTTLGNDTRLQPTSPSMRSPAMAPQNMMGLHHSSAGYFPKDQNIPHSGIGTAHSHDNTLHSDSYWSQPTQFGSGSHGSYHTYSPPNSPPRLPQSPGPREMDGNNAEMFDMVRKPVPIRSDSTNNVPTYAPPSVH